MSQEWVAQELAETELSNARRNKRSVTLLDLLADPPTASVSDTGNRCAGPQAAYRFLPPGKILWQPISPAHRITRKFDR